MSQQDANSSQQDTHDDAPTHSAGRAEQRADRGEFAADPAPVLHGGAADAANADFADALLRTRDRLRAQLDELAAEMDDLAQAVAHERREQELGIPSLALVTLQAHLYGAHAALLWLQAVMTQVEVLCETPRRDPPLDAP